MVILSMYLYWKYFRQWTYPDDLVPSLLLLSCPPFNKYYFTPQETRRNICRSRYSDNSVIRLVGAMCRSSLECLCRERVVDAARIMGLGDSLGVIMERDNYKICHYFSVKEVFDSAHCSIALLLPLSSGSLSSPRVFTYAAGSKVRVVNNNDTPSFLSISISEKLDGKLSRSIEQAQACMRRRRVSSGSSRASLVLSLGICVGPLLISGFAQGRSLLQKEVLACTNSV